MKIKELQLSERRIEALLHCIETQRNIIEGTDELDDNKKKRLDAELQGMSHDISGMTGVRRKSLKELL